ncbi:hypothetical protein C8C76_1652 [Halanaerobium saccharolyticum]|jgi:hypothetical protein|uniref:Uncharacterized protein n=1 Tax=Halanaerobium saccharolyticum TaxID=43595 RepID=A0A2T5RF42_9FIRM|nr:hypothetical protein C8C76_1652 [Halanaerobium saccharolyticum]
MSILKSFYTVCMDLGKYVSNLPLSTQIVIYILMIFNASVLIKDLRSNIKDIKLMMSS